MKVTLPFPPSANRYWRSDRGGRPHVSDEARAYKAAVGYALNLAGWTPHTGPVALALDFYRPAKRGDLDNFLKVTIDSLKGYAFEDDDQIVEIRARRHEGKGAPRVEVEVTAKGQ